MPLRIIWSMILVACLVHPANAQTQPAPDQQNKIEVFGNIAYGRFSNGDAVWAEGLDYGGGIGFRPFSGNLHRLGFEAQIARMNKRDGPSAASSQGSDSRLVSANVLYHFGRNDTDIQPFVFGGLAFVAVDRTTRCVDCVFDPDPVTGRPVSRGVTEERIEDTKVGAAFGGGVKIGLVRHLSVRPELLVVDTTAGTGFNWGWIRLQIGVGVHF